MIRWCIEQGFGCISKSVKEQRIIENADVFDFQISPEDMHALVSDSVNMLYTMSSTLLLLCCCRMASELRIWYAAGIYSDWDPCTLLENPELLKLIHV